MASAPPRARFERRIARQVEFRVDRNRPLRVASVSLKNLSKTVLAFAAALFYSALALYAISGGPPYPVGTDLVGTYAGVLKPKACAIPFATPTPPAPSPTPSDLSSNSIGVFSLGVPASSLATGAFILFAEGKVYKGTVEAVADNVKATVQGVLHANLALTSTGENNTEGQEQANGNFDSRVVTTSAAAFTLAGIRLRGKAALYISPADAPSQINAEICMKINGFKQSTSAPAAVSTGQ